MKPNISLSLSSCLPLHHLLLCPICAHTQSPALPSPSPPVDSFVKWPFISCAACVCFRSRVSGNEATAATTTRAAKCVFDCMLRPRQQREIGNSESYVGTEVKVEHEREAPFPFQRVLPNAPPPPPRSGRNNRVDIEKKVDESNKGEKVHAIIRKERSDAEAAQRFALRTSSLVDACC